MSKLSDPGLQGERTHLAWQRTGLAYATVGAGLTHFADGLARWPGWIALFASVVVLLTGAHRYRHALQAVRGERAAAVPTMVLAAACASLTVGIGAAAVLW